MNNITTPPTAGKHGRFRINSGKTESPAAGESTSGPSASQVAAFADGAATRSITALPTTFFSLTEKPSPNGEQMVVVKGKICRGDVGKNAYLMIPTPTQNRLDKVLTGPMTPGIIGLIEYALDELERNGKSLVIENHK